MNNQQPTRGRPIRFVKGTYAGRHGWIDSSRRETKSFSQAVIVAASEDDVERCTRVLKSSFRWEFQDPTSFEEAALQQHFDMEQTMIKLAQMFVECGICDNHQATELFKAELDIAATLQLQKGSSARWRDVTFVDPDLCSLHMLKMPNNPINPVLVPIYMSDI